MKKHLSKIFLGLSTAFFALLISARPAHAALFDFTGGVINGIFLFIGTIFATIAGYIVSILAWVVQMMLALSTGIVNSPPVQAGFPVTLALANLGFVLAIIIVAIATIFRYEQYGIKQFLAKVIVMAVLVNFGLILTGAALTMSDSLTTYYLNSLTGNNPSDFATRMVGALNPQGLFSVPKDVASSTSAAGDLKIDGKTLSVGGMQSFMSLLITIVGCIMIIITLLALIVMLLKRYITLVLLLITLPLAWMAWVFPSLKKHFGTWWSSFTKNLIFPPVVLFFLWIAITAAVNMRTSPDVLPNMGTGLKATIGVAAYGFLSPFLNVFIMTGLMMGGIMVAEELGVKGADVGAKMAGSLKGAALGKVKGTGQRVARKAGGAIGASKAGQGLASGLQTSRLANVLTLGGAAAAGRGLERMRRAPEANLEEEKKKVAALDAIEVKNRIPTAKGDELTALLERASKTGKVSDLLNEKDKDGNETLAAKNIKAQITKMAKAGDPQFVAMMRQAKAGGYANDLISLPEVTAMMEKEETEKLFERLGGKADFDDAMDTSGLGFKRDFDALQKATTDEKRAELESSMKKRVSKLSPEVAAKFFKKADEKAAKNMFGMVQNDMEKMQQDLARRVAANWAPSKFSKLVGDMDTDAVNQYTSVNDAAGITGENVNESLRKYLKSGAAAGLGVDDKIFKGIKTVEERVKDSGIAAPTASEASKFGTSSTQTPADIKEAVAGKEKSGLVDSSGNPL